MFSHTGLLHRVLFPSVIWKMTSTGVFLTFDDGPHPEATPAVLDVLRRNSVHATFFITGTAVKKNPELVLQIAAEGHSLGIHGYQHKRSSAVSKRITEHEIVQTEKEIRDAGAQPCLLFRPPFGFFTWNTIAAANSLHYKLVMWTTLTGDFRPNWPDDKVVKTALQSLSGGAVLVFHDNELTKSRIKFVLQSTIVAVRELGYSFEKMS